MNQCKACPWRKGVKPKRDIPGGYCERKHAALKSTIAEPSVLTGGVMRMMACHETAIGAERACTGWVVNQLGEGNNIGLRILAMEGRFKDYRTEGPQHSRLKDTLPK